MSKQEINVELLIECENDEFIERMAEFLLALTEPKDRKECGNG
jgi:hypothetical protein